ncbi:MAG: hypothetical protein KGI50_01900 [Patescibacteria group bacterium]|nr:hypothetical protein [Patescibacteria group bacterium]MDE2437902.1 hypothetical protein [Patescibacteria group bacterium]
MSRAVIVPENYYIKPGDIDTSKPFLGIFGKLGAEVFGHMFVQMCQHNGFWNAFTRDELAVCCTQAGANMFFLDWFIVRDLLVCDMHGKFCATLEFVNSCPRVTPPATPVQ